ncbi:MAG: inorganic phosphate transporter [Ignavibacteriales bacterium CG12_big_fil_rev_8_21_14_0_65_30_8]|nr:MAG: inorganic phosphate transporter [Ignavibacteriales bacterium CG12_big_fil_rev_8_21_14_0_65_30_8]
MEYLIVIFAILLISYYNGANDNIKGVATLYGCDTVSYRKAILWGSFTTATGSMFALLLAQKLIENFSGKGLFPSEILNTLPINIPIALGAGLTVLLATKIGMPVSTTHSIFGALFGTGLVAAGSAVNFTKLFSVFLIPLLFGPLFAFFLSFVLYKFFRSVRIKLGIDEETCVCVGEKIYNIALPVNTSSNILLQEVKKIDASVESISSCKKIYIAEFFGISAQSILDTAHFISAGFVSFARGLNDTPKLLGLFIFFNFIDPKISLLAVAAVMLTGGFLSSKKVSETISKKITPLNDGQGFTANFATGLSVITGSLFGLPLSTTHVSIGAIFGIGATNKDKNKKLIKEIIYSWVLTLPVAAILGALFHLIIVKFIY